MVMRPDSVSALPVTPASSEDGEGRQHKRDQRLRRERQRTMTPREQCENLWEAVNQGRRVVELADHKARYAMVVMGVVNAGVFLLVTRSSHFVQMVPDSIRPWFSLLVFPFGITTMIFLVDAYNSLRPRPPAMASIGSLPSGEKNRPVGLVFWDSLLTSSLPDYQRSWETVRRGQFNNELAAMAYSMARSIDKKYAALHRLYIELLVIILLAGLMLAIPVITGYLSFGPEVIPQP
jgi:hypothetical protein